MRSNNSWMHDFNSSGLWLKCIDEGSTYGESSKFMANSTDVVASREGVNLIQRDSINANSSIILAEWVTLSQILAPVHYRSKNLSEEVYVRSNYTVISILLSMSSISSLV